MDYKALVLGARRTVGDISPRGPIGPLITALCDAVEALERDRERLDWLLDELQFDELDGNDVHIEALRLAEKAGREEPNGTEYPQAYRNIIDRVRAVPTPTASASPTPAAPSGA